jgi:GNAT superfamily N-acetyltransferase
MALGEVWQLDPARHGELARRVYARSWPVTARPDFSCDEIIHRLGDRDLLWWQRKLSQSPVRLGAGPANGGFGFLLAAPEPHGWDVTYLFCEPESFGTGLADTLHAHALDALRPVTDTLGGWVLAGNGRSQAFLSRRGWTDCGVQPPPWPTLAQFHRYELRL